MGVSLNWLKQYVDVEETPWVVPSSLHSRIWWKAWKKRDIIMVGPDPHRGCLGMINLAHEVSALNGRPVRMPEVVCGKCREHEVMSRWN